MSELDSTELPGTEPEPPPLINSETLDFVYEESKTARGLFLGDLESFNKRADQQTQFTILLIGVFVTVANAVTNNATLKWLESWLLLSIIIFSVTTALTLWGRLKGDFYAGTIYPHVLLEQLDLTKDDVKLQLVETLSESYYYNVLELAVKVRIVSIAGVLQIIGILIPIISIIIEAIV